MTRPFEGVLGNTCELRLLEFLLPLNDIEFNVTELSEEAGVNRVTAGRVVKKFVERGIFNASNDKITQYSINTSSPIVRAIEIINNELINQMLGDGQIQEIRGHLKKHGMGACLQETEISNESVWPYLPEVAEPATAWGAGDMCSMGISNPYSQDFPHATADEYGAGYPDPEYIQ
ncbi:ArsR family transcriptional regulator [Methanomicrobium antiquum]|uniref:ArsR family transcriptional regulator n=1 Tax=Methanomicrobium antiquum TaxID=487686 RepID=A0AAF0FMI2_9EURY|nr:ArsR family transcriptional regulator [Methanomicrobium antiquum]WFN36262.1 ArsR family transcriptional regulator [Methanomicrobium antiquum]